MRPYSQALEQLREAGLRPTRQRLALAKLLFENAPLHVTAEGLHADAHSAKIQVSLATVYNTLHQFTHAGLLKEVVVDPMRSYFDTTTGEHGHFFYENSGQLEDIPAGDVQLAKTPTAPKGMRVKSVDVVVRLAED